MVYNALETLDNIGITLSPRYVFVIVHLAVLLLGYNMKGVVFGFWLGVPELYRRVEYVLALRSLLPLHPLRAASLPVPPLPFLPHHFPAPS